MIRKGALAIATLLVCASPATADDLDAARDHYHKAKRAFDVGEYDEAAREYVAAYKAKDDPALLYNIAQAHRLAGNHAQALRFYKTFLSRQPDAPNRAEVEMRIRELSNMPDDPDTEVAKRRFAAGQALYAKEKYREAIVEFQAAKEAKATPAFDFNIGRAYDRLGDWDAAISYYEIYAGATPRPGDADEVQRRVDVLKKRRAEKPAAPAAAATAPAPAATALKGDAPSAAPARKRSRAWVWGVVAGAVVVVGVGVGLGVGLGMASPQDPTASSGQVHWR